MITDEIKQLHEYGLNVDLSWGNYIHVSFGLEHRDIAEYVAMYSYYENNIFTYEQAVEFVLAVVKNWLNRYRQSGEFTPIGSLDTMVDRNFKVDKIIDP